MGKRPSQPVWTAAQVALVYDNYGYDVEPGPSSPPRSSSPSWGVLFNLTNAIAGASIIYIPHAMAEGGFLPVLGLLFLCGGLTLYAMNILVILGHHHHARSFEDLAQLAFGVPGYLAVCFFQFTFSFGANCSYLLVIADTLPVVLGRLCKMHFAHGEPVPSSQTPWYLRLATDRYICVTFVTFVVLLPICIHRSFASLEKFAGLSVVSVVFCTGVVLFECVFHKDEYVADSRGFMYDYIEVHTDIFPALGTIAFAYVCQHQTFLVYNTMFPATPRAFADVSRIGVAVSVVLICALSIPGYLLFLHATRSDIFLNFTDLSDKLIQVCRLLTAVNMILTYPQEFMVARHTVQRLVDLRHARRSVVDLFQEQAKPINRRAAWHDPIDEDLPTPSPLPPSSELSTHAHVLVTLFLLASTLLISIADRRLGDVTSLTGSFSAVALAFVLPAACHLKLQVPIKERGQWKDRIFPWFTITFGTIVFFVSTTTTILAIHRRHTSALP
ncbi:hypothetical protein H310_04784 [Aphanomyces invadans]|uniref:Amino acid transporter transmembrane domain-containing protein n=1 Tax=Aphanomyces invadans TaxID=157072 RepID=A0A024UBL2_9STRA|nr:hypothetical protein H310_04784 [Aphanomyces invadans]ETW03277.1 hypothetical protein H310_04784 [Aphanomyces invadans]|eukprot:XP_008867506.1 hypothetical protein H310_04784 [Aphanomyces invadans]